MEVYCFIIKRVSIIYSETSWTSSIAINSFGSGVLVLMASMSLFYNFSVVIKRIYFYYRGSNCWLLPTSYPKLTPD